MVKLETYRRRRTRHTAVDYRKCTAVAAVVSALIVVGVELVGGPVAPANAGLNTSTQAVTGAAPATAPATAAR